MDRRTVVPTCPQVVTTQPDPISGVKLNIPMKDIILDPWSMKKTIPYLSQKTCHDTPDVYPPPASWTNLAGMTSEEEAHTHNQPGRVSLAMNLIKIVL